VDTSNLLNVFISLIIPAVWASVGPVVTAAITAWVNSIPKAYVPRPVQVIVSGLLTAVVAGLTAGAEGMAPGTAAAGGLALGMVTQTLAALQPKTLLTSAPGAK
jgi:hypothetical protein